MILAVGQLFAGLPDLQPPVVSAKWTTAECRTREKWKYCGTAPRNQHRSKYLFRPATAAVKTEIDSSTTFL